MWVNIYSIMCEQVANRAGRWSKERTYTRRAISSQYVVCAIYTYDTMYMIHYIFRWSKERTYTRRAISSQYVVCACFCAQYIYSWHKKRTYIQSLIFKESTLTQSYFCFCMQAISIANAFAAFVYKLFPANIARYCCQLLRSSNYQPLQAWVKFAERGNFV